MSVGHIGTIRFKPVKSMSAYFIVGRNAMVHSSFSRVYPHHIRDAQLVLLFQRHADRSEDQRHGETPPAKVRHVV